MDTNKIIVLGSSNYDTFLSVERLPQVGETISSTGILTCPGGKGANQAAACAKLGVTTQFISQFGEDTAGDYLKTELKGYNVDLTNSTTLKGIPTGSAYITSFPDGDNSIIIVGGANQEWDAAAFEESIKQKLEGSSILLLQREIPEKINVLAAKAAKTMGIKVILDMGGADTELTMDLLSNVSILSPNETELERVVGKKVSVEDNGAILESLKELQSRANNPSLEYCLKMGDKGSKYISKEGNITAVGAAAIPEGEAVVDTTGAGDCFTGALAVGLVQQKSIEDCLKFACKAAMLTILKKGAMNAMPLLSEV